MSLSNIIKQWPGSVLGFSSQYANPSNMSYSVRNLACPLSRFPIYGDFLECAVWVGCLKLKILVIRFKPQCSDFNILENLWPLVENDRSSKKTWTT